MYMFGTCTDWYVGGGVGAEADRPWWRGTAIGITNDMQSESSWSYSPFLLLPFLAFMRPSFVLCGRYTYPGCIASCSFFFSLASASQYFRSLSESAFHCWLMVLDKSAWRCFFVGPFAAASSCAACRSSQHLRRNRMNAFSGRLT